MEERKLDLSVVVLVYNQAETLQLVLRALRAQDFPGSYEIIVADDGSSQELFRACQEYFERSPIPIKYIRQQHRHFRAAAARNNGINISKGRILLFLDGDLVPAQDTLRKHVEAHASSKIMVAGNRKWRGELSGIQHLPGGPIEKVLQFLESGFEVDDLSQNRERKEREARKKFLVSPHPWRACFSSNLSVEWSSEVRFDENFVGWGAEDWEFSHRLCTKNGYSPTYCDDITAYHLETPDAVGNVFRTGAHEEIVMYMKNMLYFFDKCPDLPIEEVFFGFPRFVLDATTNRWHVIPRPNPSSYDLEGLIQKARRWCMEFGVK